MLAYNMLALSLVRRIDPRFELADYISDEALPIAISVENTFHKDIRAKVGAERLTYNRTFKKSPSDHLTKAFSRMVYPALKLPVPTFIGTGGKDKGTPPRMQQALSKELMVPVPRSCKRGIQILIIAVSCRARLETRFHLFKLYLREKKCLEIATICHSNKSQCVGWIRWSE